MHQLCYITSCESILRCRCRFCFVIQYIGYDLSWTPNIRLCCQQNLDPDVFLRRHFVISLPQVCCPLGRHFRCAWKLTSRSIKASHRSSAGTFHVCRNIISSPVLQVDDLHSKTFRQQFPFGNALDRWLSSWLLRP